MLDPAKLRPVDGTPAAIRAALHLCGQYAVIIGPALDEAQVLYDRATLIGVEAGRDTALTHLTTVKRDAELVMAAQRELTRMLAAAGGGETPTLDEARARVLATALAFDGWWRSVGNDLVKQVQDGIGLFTRSMEAVAGLSQLEASQPAPQPPSATQANATDRKVVQMKPRSLKRPRPTRG